MSEKTQDANPPEQLAIVRRTPNYRSIYANQTYLTWSGTDVQVVLATASYEDDKLIHEQEATLYLAPAQAKFLGMALLKAVEGLERQQNTKIDVPASMLEWLKTWAE